MTLEVQNVIINFYLSLTIHEVEMFRIPTSTVLSESINPLGRQARESGCRGEQERDDFTRERGLHTQQHQVGEDRAPGLGTHSGIQSITWAMGTFLVLNL